MNSTTYALIKELEDQLEALVIAIPKEEAAHHFYLVLANSTKNEGTRNMFLQLAAEELDHKRSLEKVAEDIQREIASVKAKK